MAWFRDRSRISEMPQASVLKRGQVQKTFLVKMIFYYNANKTHFYKKGFTLGLVLRVRVFGTRKWPIVAKILVLLEQLLL